MKTPQQLLRKVFPPMLATLVDEPPTDTSKWAYELKYDGFRALVAFSNGNLAIWSRNELDLAPRFPRITEQLAKLEVGEAVIDGEIVATDEQGVPRFQLLQGGAHRETIFVFDLLWLDGHDLRQRPYVERRSLLERLLRRPPTNIALSKQLEMSGAEALEMAAKAGWEGIIAKHKSSPYEPRRSREWLKLKALQGQEFAIIGWNPSTHSSKEIGALHLGYVGDDGKFHYAGKVGTGFSAKLRVWLRDELSKDVVPAPVASDAPRVAAATWVRPRFVAQVAYTEWTNDNRLRHPSFLGLRDDKKPEEVVRERSRPAALDGKASTNMLSRNTFPSAPTELESQSATQESRMKQRSGTKRSTAAKERATSATKAKPISAKKSSGRPSPAASRASSPTVTLTHPERLLFPRDKITKEDVAAYYAAVADPMIATLSDRPLALEHWNAGIDQPSWFHQNVGREAPDWVTTVETPTRASSRATVRHLVVDRPETLRWLAQMSVLTIHMWSARGASLEQPDWLIFDLDPAKGKGFEQAVEAAIVMRGLLENMELPSVPKTSGKRGIHVLVPLAPGQTHDQAVDFATSIAAAVAAHVPDITVERSIAKRRGRLYLDALQNGYGKTVVSPYSLRAMDGAPVSAPVKWEEITRKLDPKKFNLRTMPDRLAKVGDLFAPLLTKGVRLPSLK
jgi:bifunctional non-homologous end joining protein LigD